MVHMASTSTSTSDLFSVHAGDSSLCNGGEDQPRSLRLEQVVVICRHGDRTPIKSIGREREAESQRNLWRALLPSKTECEAWDQTLPVFDKNDSKDPIPCNTRHNPPYGQLTLLGVVEARRLGYTLRQRYIESNQLLPESLRNPRDEDDSPPRLNSHDFYFRSTNYQRTRQTLQNLLIGLYPELLETTHGPMGRIFTVKDDQETMYPNAIKCCRQGEIIRTFRKRAALASSNRPEVIELMERLRARLHLQPNDRLPPWSSISDVLTCQKRYRLPFSLGMSDQDRQLIHTLKNESWSSWSGVRELQRLAVGSMLSEVLEHMRPVALGDGEKRAEGRKLVVYSGHDSTLLPLLHAFDAFLDWPPYASNFILELWRDEDQHDSYVRVVFNGDVVPVFGEKSFCKWETFVAGVKRFVPHNFSMECACTKEKGTS